MEEGEAGTAALRAGLRARCPRCGQGALFKRGLVLRDACERCGLSYAFADAGDGPAVFATFILGFLILAGALLWGLVTPIVAFFLLRVLKGTLIALQYKHKAAEWRFAGDR